MLQSYVKSSEDEGSDLDGTDVPIEIIFDQFAPLYQMLSPIHLDRLLTSQLGKKMKFYCAEEHRIIRSQGACQ